MPFLFGNSNGAMNSTTQVTLVSAPAAATQRGVRNTTFFNRDTIAHTITIKLNDNGTLRTLDSQTVAAGQAWMYSVFKVLDATTKTLVAVMGEVISTTQPDFDSAWSDNS